MTRSLLFVVHSFPPAGGSGPNRALAFTRYLPEHGWRPIVLTPGAYWAANRDDALLREVPPDTCVVRTRSWEPRPGPPPRGAALARPAHSAVRRSGIAQRLKSHAAHARRFPDAHVGWTVPAIATGLRIIRQRRVDLLYSTAGPFTNHLVALALHRLTGTPWVAELRDGWYRWNRAIFPDYPMWRGWLEGPLEKAVVTGAARFVLATELMARAFRSQYPNLSPDHFVAIPNGFDRAQYADLPPHEPDSARFEVLHAGALYHGRSVEAFLDAAGRLAAHDPRFKSAFRLTLVGSLDEGARDEVARQMARHNLGASVDYRGYLEHRAAIEVMRRADLLLAIVNSTPGAEATVPGKLFEYLAVGRPIFAITPPGAEGADIVRRTRAGWIAPAHDVDAIETALRAAFNAHQSRVPFQPDPTEVARFDRRTLAAALARVFDEAAR